MNQKNKTFEESMQRLEQIVRTMERVSKIMAASDGSPVEEAFQDEQ